MRSTAILIGPPADCDLLEQQLALLDAGAPAAASGRAPPRRPAVEEVLPPVTPVAALLLCAPAQAAWTVVDGRVVVREGRLATVDAGPLVERHNRLARILVGGGR